MRQGRQGWLWGAVLVLVCSMLLATGASGQSNMNEPPDEAGDDPIANRGDRYVPEPPGTVKKMRFWYGPYSMPAGWDANRVDLDLPVHDGMSIGVEPELRLRPGWKEPRHQGANSPHAYGVARDP